MQITDALKNKNEGGGIKQGDPNKLCSTHNLVPPMKNITPDTVEKCAEKLEPIPQITTEEKETKKNFEEGK